MRSLLILIFFLPGLLLSQTVVIKGTITDDYEGAGVSGAAISSENTYGLLGRTDKKGEFQFSYTFKGKDLFKFSRVGFLDKYLEVDRKMMRKTVKDTLYLNIVMVYKTLAPLKINDPGIPDTAYGSEYHSISDYEFYEDRFIFLAYDHNLRRGSKVMLVDQFQQIVSEYTVPERAIRLKRDYDGTVNVICENAVYIVEVFGDHIRLHQRDKDFYETYITPIADTLNDYAFYSNYSPDFPAFNYFLYNVRDSSRKRIMHVEDDLIMDLYTSEYKYVDGAEKVWAMNKEEETGIDKEIWAGLKYFTSSIYYKPLYAPLFVINNEPVIFDHYHNRIMLFNEDCNKRDSLPIFYHLLKGKQSWDHEVICDNVAGRVYALMQQDGYHILAEIDLETGKMEEAHKLFFKYSEQIQVKDNIIYYIYRPFESTQKKFLYTEKMGF